ncbi:hypothetical protein [Paraburkholderia hospita]|uniref:hypothetical protein n=1 Tax=Paraburkholderia hospita TaxID=169430 RepID=UPI003ECFCFE2
MNTLVSTTDGVGYVRAFRMPDDSMHPRIMMGEFALLADCDDIADELGNEVLLQLDDGKSHLRTVQECSARTVTLSGYNLSGCLTLRRCDIASAYRVDMIVSPRTFALMTEQYADQAEACHG